MQPADEMRASDAERGRAVELLAAAATDGRLSLEEFAQRSGDAYAARTIGELGVLTGDLQRPVPPAVGPDTPVQLTAVLGNESRKGRWVVPAHLRATSVLGDCHLEMQDAVLPQRTTTIEATAVLGSVTIFVPDGVDVRLSGAAVLGGKSSRLRREPPPGAPVLVVHCRVFAGSITVRPPA